MRPLHILIWHVHDNYLYYLTKSQHEFFLPSNRERTGDYAGRWGRLPWPDNVRDVPVEEVHSLRLDCIIFQKPSQYQRDLFKIFSKEQQQLPKIYIEHDPPRESPTDTRHFIDDPNVLLVHVTPFNALMWDNGRTPVKVIEHGITVPENTAYSGELPRGISVVNNLGRRGRRLGRDIFEQARALLPLDLAGIGSEEMGGLGEIFQDALPSLITRYRFFFNPIRYASLGLSVCEAMMLGMPIIGLATTEMAVTVENGITGYVNTDVNKLFGPMRELLNDPGEARKLGDNARMYARERFNIQRFLKDWDDAFSMVTGNALRSGVTVGEEMLL